jgi:hypothetical protein
MDRVMKTIAIMTVLLSITVGIVTIVRLILEHLRRIKSECLQADLCSKMLDKFGSSQELLVYLQSEAGQNLLKAAPLDRPQPHGRILNSVQGGIVGTALGLGLLIIMSFLRPDGRQPAMVMGTLLLSAGLGLLAGAIAAYVLSRRLGLIAAGTR